MPLTLLTVLVGLLGCEKGEDTAGGDTQPVVVDPCELDSITIELGTGEDEYLPLSDGDTLEMVRGPQSGWHFILAFLAYQSEEIMWYEVAGYDVATGELVCQHGTAPVNQRLEAQDECRGTYRNIYCYALTPMADALVDGDCDTPPETLVDRELRFELQYRDDTDRSATDQLFVIAAPDPDDRTDCHEETIGDTGDTGDTGD